MIKLFSAFFSFLFFFFSLLFVYTKPLLASEKTDIALIKKISRDYTKKFCNGIGFGLSKESALKFANKENNLIFNKKIIANDLNRRLIATEIANSVVVGCGYSIDLEGEEDIKEFENEYISINNILSNESLSDN
tara:strand:- start:415 stop:816 length:402 start_codon:yes stop_codon:yes gene_type:complete